MRTKPYMILTSSALVGLTAAYCVTQIRKSFPPELPANVYVSADHEGLVELPEEPKPLPAEPPLMPVLLQPEPMPALMDVPAITVSLRQPVEEETPAPIPAPSQEPPLEVAIASPEEAPASEEFLPMPVEERNVEEVSPIPAWPADSGASEGGAVRRGLLPLPATVLEACQPTALGTYWNGFPLAGSYECLLENGGDQLQLNLPPAVWELLQGSGLYIGLAPDRKCLWIYSNLGVERLVRHVCNLRVCLSRLHFVAPSRNHVFTLPAKLVQAAGLGKDVVLIGVRDHFELWDAKRWQEYSEGKSQADATQPTNELLNTSEDFRKMEYDWERPWITEQPSHLAPERVHGGIQ